MKNTHDEDAILDTDLELMDPIEIPILAKLSRDLKGGSKTLTAKLARFLVDRYYQIQHFRINAQGQKRAVVQGVDDGGTHEVISFFLGQFETVEKQLKSALGAYAAGQVPGQWMQSICGIAEVISAGMLAHVNIERAPHAGNVIRFAGLTNDEWLGADKAKALVIDLENRAENKHDLDELMRMAEVYLRRAPGSLMNMMLGVFGDEEEKEEEFKPTRDLLIKTLSLRPWNADLKCLAVFKLGESFVKVQNRPKDYYGKKLIWRKTMYAEANAQGKFSKDAEKILSEKRIGKSTDAYAAYSVGMLPKGHVHARARRWAVKLFISHLHEVMFFSHYGRLPALPYALDILGHVDFEPPPNMAKVPGLREAYEQNPQRRIYLK
jgi:hypothetical protein